MKNKTNTIYKSILTILFTSALSACGGGGSDDSAPKSNSGTGSTGGGTTGQAMTVSPSTATISVEELSIGTFDITASNSAGNVTVTNDYTGNSTLTTTANGDGITVTLDSSDVIIDEVSSFNVTINDGTTTKTVSVNMTIANTSGNILADDLELIAAKMTGGNLHTETESIMTVYNKIALLTGGYSRAMFTRLASDFQASKTISYAELGNSGTNADAITERVNDYRAGALTELDISAFSEELSVMLIDSTKALTVIINQVADKANKLTSIPEFKYNHSAQGLSIYTGNKLMGEWVDDEWVFNDTFSIVDSAISNPCSAQ